MSHMPQLDTQDRERDNPHRAGPENLSNLCEYSMVVRWPFWVGVWLLNPTNQDVELGFEHTLKPLVREKIKGKIVYI